MKRVLIAVLTCVVLGTLTGSAHAHHPECSLRWPAKTTIRFATPFNPGHILADTAEMFKDIIECTTHGLTRVEIEAGLASEEQVNLDTTAGLVDIQATGGEPLEVYAPEYFFFNAPFVIIDYDHFLRVWDGPLGAAAKDLVKQNGNQVSLSTVFRGFRQTTSNSPILEPDDIVGLALRLPGVPDWISVWQNGLEASPVPVPLPDLYNALATGLAEASEGDLTQISSFNLYEVQTHLALTQHLVGVGWVNANQDFFEGLRFWERWLVVWAIRRASALATQQIIDNEGELLAFLQEQGMTVTTPDTEAIRAKAEDAVNDLFATKYPVTTWAEVLAQ